MAQVCDLCGKGPQFGNNISHATQHQPAALEREPAPVKAKVNGGNKRIRVCTSCIKTGKVSKAKLHSQADNAPAASEPAGLFLFLSTLYFLAADFQAQNSERC